MAKERPSLDVLFEQLSVLEIRGDRVLVLPDDENEFAGTLKLIINPKINDDTKPAKGIIMAIGPGDAEHPMPEDLQVGMKVVYGKYSGMDLEHEGTEYLSMRESDITAYYKNSHLEILADLEKKKVSQEY